MKHYTKPSVNAGEWHARARGHNEDGVVVRLDRQFLDGTYQDHYAIYIAGKRQRKTYFGETAHWDAARAYNDLVDLGDYVFGDEL